MEISFQPTCHPESRVTIFGKWVNADPNFNLTSTCYIIYVYQGLSASKYGYIVFIYEKMKRFQSDKVMASDHRFLSSLFSWQNWFYFVWVSSNFGGVKIDSCHEYGSFLKETFTASIEYRYTSILLKH